MSMFYIIHKQRANSKELHAVLMFISYLLLLNFLEINYYSLSMR